MLRRMKAVSAAAKGRSSLYPCHSSGISLVHGHQHYELGSSVSAVVLEARSRYNAGVSFTASLSF
jgi:hypothetical protein